MLDLVWQKGAFLMILGSVVSGAHQRCDTTWNQRVVAAAARKFRLVQGELRRRGQEEARRQLAHSLVEKVEGEVGSLA